MSTLIFRTMAPWVVAVMVVFSLFLLLRGHNEPGGGFVGGLIAASSVAILALANGAGTARRAIAFDPLAISGAGVVIAGLSGLFSLAIGAPFLTGLWTFLTVGEHELALSTPLMFDVGVYLTVFGAVAAIALALLDGEDGD